MSGAALFGMMIWLLYIRFIVPVLGVFFGTALIADEIEDKTITYLFTRPIPRSAVLVGKYLAYLVCTILLVLPSVVLVYFITVPLGGDGARIGRTFPALVKDLGMLAVGLASYGAVFALVGARLKRPLVSGLVFAFGWEPGVSALSRLSEACDGGLLLAGARAARDAERVGRQRAAAVLQRRAADWREPGLSGGHYPRNALAGW